MEKITDKLTQEGFTKWERFPSSKGIQVVCSMNIKLFVGDDDIPVLIRRKEVDFDKDLIVVFSETKSVLYCCVHGKGMINGPNRGLQ